MSELRERAAEPSVASNASRRARRTVRAAVLEAPGHFALHDIASPEPGPDEVRVRIEGCGVCASSIPLFEGRPWFEYPRAPGEPGHEGWGRVEAIGERVRGITVGDRVAALSYRAFAEVDVLPATNAVVLPPSLERAEVPGEPLGCAMNIFARSAIEPGMTVAIVGVGYLGALLTQLASRAGARVIAISRRDAALETARACGASELVRFEARDRVVGRVSEMTGGALCDRAIECVGLQDALDVASALVRERGRLVIAGFHQDGSRQVDMFQWNWRGLDVINAHERDPMVYVAGMRAAIDALVDGRLDPTPLHTHRFSLGELDAAFDAARTRPDGFLKALVVP